MTASSKPCKTSDPCATPRSRCRYTWTCQSLSSRVLEYHGAMHACYRNAVMVVRDHGIVSPLRKRANPMNIHVQRGDGGMVHV